MEENMLIKQVTENPSIFIDLKNPSDKVIKAALSKNGNLIKYVQAPTVEQKRIAIGNSPLAVEGIKYLEEELQIMAVRLLWNSLKYIKNPSYLVKAEAVKTRGWAIQYIVEPEEELELIAVKRDYDAIKYIQNPSKKVQLAAIKNYFGAIKYIQNPDIDVKRAAILQDEEAVNYINSYDQDELGLFIRDNIKVIKYVYDSIEPEFVVDILIDKIKKDDFSEEYMKAFLDLELLQMDKVKFIWEYGNKRIKKLLVDYKLSR